MGATSVYCEVRAESVYIIEVLRDNVMAQSVSRRPLIAGAPAQFQFRRVRFLVGKVALGRVFLRVLPFLPVRIILSVLQTHTHLQGAVTGSIAPPPPQSEI